MAFYRVIALPEELTNETRASLKSPGYGHPVYIEVASSYGPCRSCLRTFRQGEEERVLLTYNPFEGLDAYPSPGPVFIHREGCTRYEEEGFPEGIRHLPLTLEAYAPGRWLVARERVAGGDVDGPVERLFAHPAVEYIHVRNTEAGCYIARIERVEEAVEEARAAA